MINFIKRLFKLKQRQEKIIERFKSGYTTFQNGRLKYSDEFGFKHSAIEIFDEGIYEFSSKSDSPLIVDCGANIGLSVLFFKKRYPTSTVIAFEADPSIYATLLENVEEFKLKNVNLYNLALWDLETTLTFYKEGSLAGSLHQRENREGVNVKTVLLSFFLKDQKIDYLKIDIEGAELNVLKEAERYLDNVRNIFIEYHSEFNQKQNLSEILSILERNNFRYYIKAANDWLKYPLVDDSVISPPDFYLQLNILAQKL